MPISIAIDGPAGSGKGTVARGVARELGYAYLDTGAMYRAVALWAEREGVSWAEEDEVAALAERLSFSFVWDGDALRVIVDGHDATRELRSDHAGTGASVVSKLPAVRRALLGQQRELGRAGGIVMDGRDIGTVVLPEAQLKIYLDADLDERARRRHDELVRRGETPHLDDVRAAMADRDRQDMERASAPLRAADDAVHLDTTDLTIREAVAEVLALARARGA